MEVSPMQLPRERGPISRHVIQRLTAADDSSTAPGPDIRPTRAGIVEDEDAQLALWILYELHYRGFEGVSADLDWDGGLLELRRLLEARFERELREAVKPTLEACGEERDGVDVGAQIFAMVDADDGPSVASFLHREASLEQMLELLREKSLQQLKESDPQAFVLPRLEGRAKVALAELLYDEFGAGRPSHLHQALYADALTAAGLDPTYGAYVDEVSALTLANANVASLFALNRGLLAAAMGHFAMFEATSSVPSRKIAAGIERLGLPPAVATYFHEHVEADAVHEQIAVVDICGTLVSEKPSVRADVLFGAASCLHLEGLSGRELLSRWTARMDAAS
jgi:hypothetical protein